MATFGCRKNCAKGWPPDGLFKAVKREDGVIELRPQIAVDASLFQYWTEREQQTERWQQMEREADEDIAAGRVEHFDGVEELFAYLDGTEERQ